MNRIQSAIFPTRLACALALLVLLASAGPAGAQPPLFATLQGSGGDFGHAVAGAGDFNADGKDDLLVGAPWADVFGTDSGAVYVYYGGNPLTAGPILEGFGLDGTGRGYAVSSAGRFNDDGIDDIVMCQRGGESLASVYLGGSPPPTGVSYALLPTQPGTQIVDPDAWGTFCDAVGFTDFNGDGMDDVMVGAPLYDDGNDTASGRAYLYFGRPLTGPVETYADHVLDAGVHQEVGGRFGTSVVGLDFNQDGYGDFAVGASGSTKVLLYLGSASGVPGTPLVFSEAVGGFGNALAAGDVNHDSQTDLVVGAADVILNFTAESGVFRYYGDVTPDTVEDGFYQAPDDYSLYGWAVAVVDPEDEGYDNLLVGDPSWYYDSSGFTSHGRVYDVSKGYRFDGDASVDELGHSLANLGDFTGDGKEDFAVGAPQGSSGDGYVRIYRGFTPDTQPCGRKCPDEHDGSQTDP